jgi:hypothetical protein
MASSGPPAPPPAPPAPLAAGVPVPGAPQVPLAPPLPFAADPGSITGWLMGQASTSTSALLTAEIDAVEARYTALPDAADATNSAFLRAITDDALASDDLSVYLTASKPSGQPPFVSVVLCLTRYSAGLGGLSAFQGRTMGFIGEMVGDQLPTLVAVPDSAGQHLPDLLQPKTCVVPTILELDAAFAVATPPSVIAPPAHGAEQELPRLLFLPKAWAAHFLDAKPPYAALKVMERLVATLPLQAERDKADLYLSWCKAACVRAGGGAADRSCSAMQTPWQTPDLADRRLVSWAQKQLAPYRRPFPPAPAPPLAPNPFFPGPPLAGHGSSAAKQYTAMEHLKVRSACSLFVADYPTYVPSLYAEILAEGRTTVKVQAVLHQRLRPDPTDDHPVAIYVSTEMARDVKDLAFGYGGDKSYETCHRGISPFAVIPISAEAAAARNRLQDRQSRVSFLTAQDALESESLPGRCPSTYDGLQRALLGYQTFLRLLFGGYCAHLLEVERIRRTLCVKIDSFSAMSPSHVAGLMWSIFCDAREFFSCQADDDELPNTKLLTTRVWLDAGSLQEPFNVPTDRLLGFARPNQAIPGVPGPPSADIENPFEPRSNFPRGLSVPGPPWINPSPNATLVASVQVAVAKRASVRVLDMMQASTPKLRYRDVRIGASGGCLDFAVMGVCSAPSCSYSHAAPDSVPTQKAQKFAKLLKKAAESYVAAS